MAKDLIYKLKIPSKDIWFIQNTLENFDGLALLTEATKEEDLFCTMEVLTNTDFKELFLMVFKELKEEVTDLSLENFFNDC